jgi:2-octaprenylphenol hydroxylase
VQVYDIIIIGGGIVGTTTALALAQQTNLQIALLDSHAQQPWKPEIQDARVSAITLASQRIFQRLKVWPAIAAKRLSPFNKMHVWDTQGELEFDCKALHEPHLGYIIEDQVLRASLAEQLSAHANLHVIAPVKLISLQDKMTHQELITDQTTLYAKLIIGSDGANSWVRKQTQIAIAESTYDQVALVATVQITLSHQQTAWQHFLNTGPLAFLPLQDSHAASIVWSTSPTEAARLLALAEKEFNAELTRALTAKLGAVINSSPRLSFNLIKRHAKNYIQPRLALIGDAAHSIHPMLGQGVNLGLLDAACLVAVIIEALSKQRDFASLAVLRRYERWRKGDNATMLAMVDGLKNIFANTRSPVQSIRGMGLNSLNNLPWIKNFLAGYAAGNRNDMPPLASCQTTISVRE